MPSPKINNAAIIAIAIAIIVVIVYMYISKPTGFRVLGSRDIGGYDLAGMPITGITEKQCGDACLSNSGCDMYSYRSSDKKCWLKTPKTQSGLSLGFKK